MPDRGRLATLVDRLGSFRTRLRLFFLLIVIVPMISVTLIVFRLISESEHGQADARVAARQDAAINLYYEARDRGDALAGRIGRDPRLAEALRSGDRAAIEREVRRQLQQTGAARIVLTKNSRPLADAGSREAVFPATRELVAGGQRVAQLQVAAETADNFARMVRRVAGLETIVLLDGKVMATTLPGAPVGLLPAQSGTVKVGGKQYRAATFGAPGLTGTRIRVSVLEPEQRTNEDIRRGRVLAGAVIAGFFLLALLAAIIVSRSLQRQINAFLAAARRLGGGDFSAEVPTRGRDEFAELGEEFTKMSRQLETRLEELSKERLRLELSLRRIGETFASNLDRDALLEIVVRTAVDALNAAGGEARLAHETGGELATVARVGEDGDRPPAADEAERRVLGSGEEAFVDGDAEQGFALAHPLHAGAAAGLRSDDVTGLVAVWRTDRPFHPRERELFHYLAGQAAVSVENVGLHETVERQAVTDELTGLSNRRRFQETMATEVERAKRFGQELGLVLLDIDDFKAVNDTYGHQQGDLVLREVARILRESSREIDEPARYGGEELAVVLPGTDLLGAFNLAERVREGIEALRLPVIGDDSTMLTITASFGVAAMPASSEDLRGLVAAADEALYEAKRAGKNRTVQAV